MKPGVRQALWVNGLWIGGVLLVVLGLVGGSILSLHRARTTVAALSQDVLNQQLQVGLLPDVDVRNAELALASQTLDLWSDLVGSEARRVSELSAAARAAGVTLMSLSGIDSRRHDTDTVITSSHKLEALGNYQQLARFLTAVYGAKGMLSVRNVTLVPGAATGPGVLRASMTVVWCAPGSDPVTGADGVGAG